MFRMRQVEVAAPLLRYSITLLHVIINTTVDFFTHCPYMHCATTAGWSHSSDVGYSEGSLRDSECFGSMWS